MTFALVNHTFISGAGVGAVTTPAIDTTGANLLIMTANAFNSTTAPSDSKSNIYIPLTDSVSSVFAHCRIYYCQGASSAITSTGHTFTSGGGFAPIYAAAFSGASSSVFDVENGAGSVADSNTCVSGGITPGQNNELIIAAVTAGADDNVSITGISGGFSITDTSSATSGTTLGGGLAYLIQTTASTANPTWSFSGIDDWANRIASFVTTGTTVTALEMDTISTYFARKITTVAY